MFNKNLFINIGSIIINNLLIIHVIYKRSIGFNAFTKKQILLKN